MKPIHLLIITTTCSLFSLNSFAQKAISIVGTYKEYWGIPGQTDIDYNDTFVIAKSDTAYTISCINNNMYEFHKIVYKDQQLTFEILNTTGNDTMPYKLNLDTTDGWLKGIACSITCVETPIKWEKL